MINIMEFKGTEGDFRPDIGFDEVLHGKRYTNIVSNELGDVLAIAEGKTVEECEANAKLIAAAPELLQSLRDLVWLIDYHATDEELKESVNLRAKVVLNKILSQ